jgi:hypothetical protein
MCIRDCTSGLRYQLQYRTPSHDLFLQISLDNLLSITVIRTRVFHVISASLASQIPSYSSPNVDRYFELSSNPQCHPTRKTTPGTTPMPLTHRIILQHQPKPNSLLYITPSSSLTNRQSYTCPSHRSNQCSPSTNHNLKDESQTHHIFSPTKTKHTNLLPALHQNIDSDRASRIGRR